MAYIDLSTFDKCVKTKFNKTFQALNFKTNTISQQSASPYLVIQVGLLTPSTFTWHCLSPLAAFTSGAYFLHNER